MLVGATSNPQSIQLIIAGTAKSERQIVEKNKNHLPRDGYITPFVVKTGGNLFSSNFNK